MSARHHCPGPDCEGLREHAFAFGELADGTIVAWRYCRYCGSINFTATGLPRDTVRIATVRPIGHLRAVGDE